VGGFLKMKLKNFCEIKAIDEARAKEIIKWYKKALYNVSVASGIGIDLPISLIQLLTIFGNSEDIEGDFSQLFEDLFGESEEIEKNQLTERGKEKRKKNQYLRIES